MKTVHFFTKVTSFILGEANPAEVQEQETSPLYYNLHLYDMRKMEAGTFCTHAYKQDKVKPQL